MSQPRRAFKIHGMDCAEEVATLKCEVGPVVGGENHLAFDLLQDGCDLPHAPLDEMRVLANTHNSVQLACCQQQPQVARMQRKRWTGNTDFRSCR